LSRPETEEASAVLVELGLVEQRHKAVLEVLEGGLSVVEVARRYGVVRQTVHDWLRDYARDGIVGLADRSSKPATCPHQMAPAVEARVVALRREHPAWGPQTILYELSREGVDPLPGRSSVYRALIRHRLIDPQQRRRRRSDYKRWERSRAMELWQKDITGGVHLADGTQASIVTGVDDNSRFCVCARVVGRATAKPVCDAFAEAMRRHGVPDAVLTDNGKVFTGKYGPGKGEVLFDRICRENGIRHLLTAPRSPITTGKIERFHKTLKAECLAGRVFTSIGEAQAAIDEWVEHYNSRRPHQGIGMVPPIERFRLARRDVEVVEPRDEPERCRGDAVVAVAGLRGVTPVSYTHSPSPRDRG
jgi:transposase InsO family protein